jgi:predicted NAD/FAD-binding protein
VSVVEDARAEFARQAREIVARADDMPEAEYVAELEAARQRFEQPRYALVADQALEILRDALA